MQVEFNCMEPKSLTWHLSCVAPTLPFRVTKSVSLSTKNMAVSQKHRENSKIIKQANCQRKHFTNPLKCKFYHQRFEMGRSTPKEQMCSTAFHIRKFKGYWSHS